VNITDSRASFHENPAGNVQSLTCGIQVRQFQKFAEPEVRCWDRRQLDSAGRNL